jgi:hypothetical protein
LKQYAHVLPGMQAEAAAEIARSCSTTPTPAAPAAALASLGRDGPRSAREVGSSFETTLKVLSERIAGFEKQTEPPPPPLPEWRLGPVQLECASDGRRASKHSLPVEQAPPGYQARVVPDNVDWRRAERGVNAEKPARGHR